MQLDSALVGHHTCQKLRCSAAVSSMQDSSATDTTMGVSHADQAGGRQGKHSAWVGADAPVMAAVCLQQAELGWTLAHTHNNNNNNNACQQRLGCTSTLCMPQEAGRLNDTAPCTALVILILI